MSAFRIITHIPLVFGVMTVAGCADWQTTPTTVDEHHGVAVNNMIKNQTLYPEHSLEHRQVLILDGQKGEGIISPYRAPAVDLKRGKEAVEVDVGSSGGTSSSGN